MKYVFEKYEFSNRGRIFLGFETIFSDSTENAVLSVQERVGENVTLVPIWIPQED